MKRIIFSAAVVVLFLAASTHARTWYINTAGTGDAPTIAAGIDSAAAGDTVLVAAGTYEVVKVAVKPDIVVTSESGPALTRIVQPPQPYPNHSLRVTNHPYLSTVEISGFWFEGDGTGVLVGGSLPNSPNLTVKYCVFAHNAYAGIAASFDCRVHIENCTFVDNGLYGLLVDSGPDVQLWYSIMWDRESGAVHCGLTDYLDFADMWDNTPISSLMSEDPLFCDPTTDNYFLHSNSPCAPGNHPWGPEDTSLIGALPVACGEVNSEPTSWGRVKTLYR